MSYIFKNDMSLIKNINFNFFKKFSLYCLTTFNSFKIKYGD